MDKKRISIDAFLLDEDRIFTFLDTKLSKSFASWYAIETDMDFVISAFKMLISEPSENDINLNRISQKAFYRAAVVTYANAFGEADGRNSHLDANMFTDQKYKNLHHELLKQRHTFHAHAGISDYETLLPIILFNPENKNDYAYKTIKINFIKPPNEKIIEYISLIENVQSYLKKKTGKCAKKLLDRDIKPNIDILFQEALHRKGKR